MPDSLHELLVASGGVLGVRHGRTVVTHFGSPPGELSVCVRAVGLVDRSCRAVLTVRGADRGVARLLGVDLADGGSVRDGDAWWLKPGGGELIVVGSPRAVRSQRDRLAPEARRHGGVEIRDRTETSATVGLVGRGTCAVLARLGVLGADADPRGARPVCTRIVGGVSVVWLLASDRCALALVARRDAVRAWQAIAAAGRPLGLGQVGHDAAERYLLLDRDRLARPAPRAVSS